jgi:lipopolysaccharide biosynthesis regulator YciM
MLGRVYAAQGNYQKAINHLSGVSRSNSYMRGQLGVSYLQKGQKAGGLAILEEMKQQYAEGKQQQCYYIAMLYNMLGETETALCWLERSVAEKENELNWLEVDHEFRNLHDHPRFQRIVRGLPRAFVQNLPIVESSGE